jgi:hypothetical protein
VKLRDFVRLAKDFHAQPAPGITEALLDAVNDLGEDAFGDRWRPVVVAAYAAPNRPAKKFGEAAVEWHNDPDEDNTARLMDLMNERGEQWAGPDGFRRVTFEADGPPAPPELSGFVEYVAGWEQKPSVEGAAKIVGGMNEIGNKTLADAWPGISVNVPGTTEGPKAP